MRRWDRFIPVVVISVYLFTGIASVRPGERAVIRRFGAVVATPGPGLWVGLPWGVDRVDRVAVDFIRRVAVGYEQDGDPEALLPPGQLLTGDQNVVNVRAVIDYTVRADDVATFVATRDRVDGAISRAAETALAEWVAARPVDDVLLTGKAVLPGMLAARLRKCLEPLRLGIDVQSAGVSHLAPIDEEQVREAFSAVTRAQANIRTQEQDASAAAERMLREARSKAYEAEQQAAGQAHEQLALAKADADAFRKRLEQYRRLKQSNENVLAALWWDELGPVFARMRGAGRLDLLDNHIGKDGLDVMQVGPRQK